GELEEGAGGGGNPDDVSIVYVRRRRISAVQIICLLDLFERVPERGQFEAAAKLWSRVPQGVYRLMAVDSLFELSDL
ncbi:hypothetical protein LINGRAHAP2_LOCUS3256, partial [Linum grandiflorum]